MRSGLRCYYVAQLAEAYVQVLRISVLEINLFLALNVCLVIEVRKTVLLLVRVRGGAY